MKRAMMIAVTVMAALAWPVAAQSTYDLSATNQTALVTLTNNVPVMVMTNGLFGRQPLLLYVENTGASPLWFTFNAASAAAATNGQTGYWLAPGGSKSFGPVTVPGGMVHGWLPGTGGWTNTGFVVRREYRK